MFFSLTESPWIRAGRQYSVRVRTIQIIFYFFSICPNCFFLKKKGSLDPYRQRNCCKELHSPCCSASRCRSSPSYGWWWWTRRNATSMRTPGMVHRWRWHCHLTCERWNRFLSRSPLYIYIYTQKKQNCAKKNALQLRYEFFKVKKKRKKSLLYFTSYVMAK